MRTQGCTLRRSGLVIAFACSWLGGLAEVAAGPNSQTFSRLIEQHGPELVTVKFILKMNLGPMGEQEEEMEAAGLLIDSEGLVLCSDTQVGGIVGVLKRMFGAMGGQLSGEPSAFKVVLGSEEEERDANLIARDAELDLAWVQINPRETAQKYPSVDLANAASVAVGERVMALKRMGKHFDRCLVAETGLITGEARRPRKLWLAQASLAEMLGQPVFTEDGAVVGLIVLQLPDAEESDGFNPLTMGLEMQGMFRGVVLPAAQIENATQRARAKATPPEEKPE